MGRIYYNNEEMAQLVAEHELVNNMIEETWNELLSDVNTLEGAWEGEAARAFYEDFYSMENPMRKILEMLEQEAKAIENIRQQMLEYDAMTAAQISSI